MYLDPYDIVQEFNEKGTFQIECTEITLKQLGNNKNPQCYSGKGIICLNKDKKFELICFPSNEKATPFMDKIKRGKILKPYRIIKKNFYFRLDAKDAAGNIYFSKQVDVSGDEGRNGVVVKGEFERLYCNNLFSSENGISFQLKNRLKLTTNYQHTYHDGEQNYLSTRFLIYGLEYIFYEKNGRYQVDILVRDKRFRYDFTEIDFFLDVIRIITSTNIHFSIVDLTSNDESYIMIKSDSTSVKYSSLMKPPILANHKTDISSLSDFMSQLILFQRTRKDYRINQILNRCIHTSVSSVHAYATVISLGVEELISIYFLNNFSPSPSYIEKIEQAKKELKATKIDRSIKNNIYSSLDYYSKPSVRKLFRKLHKEKDLPKLLTDNWHSLRGYIAHPSRSNKSSNELLYYADSATTLFYWLLKEIIGYKGSLTKYVS
ncbi:hypothetical protein [Gracilimonas tropica]|uniref:hypothetical protein n=1 Tax=Gracilimonas tropica TaxID=454600 RepID=UPI0003690412|nr:hypothetical protein [Gracilimonas tropica]